EEGRDVSLLELLRPDAVQQVRRIDSEVPRYDPPAPTARAARSCRVHAAGGGEDDQVIRPVGLIRAGEVERPPALRRAGIEAESVGIAADKRAADPERRRQRNHVLEILARAILPQHALVLVEPGEVVI